MMKTKIELEMPEVKEISLNPEKTAVVVIDLENEFCAPTGKNYLGATAEEAVKGSAALIDRARLVGSPIIWVQSVRTSDALEFTAFGRKLHLIDGTWAVEYTAPLKLLTGEPIIKKRSHDCFNHTDLDGCLERNSIVAPEWSIIVVGVGLQICVNHAVLGFSVRNYQVVVPLDCVAPREGPGAVATLWRFGHRAYSYNITVSTSEMMAFHGEVERGIKRSGMAL
jgi:nicotinamidase-related amidase